MRRAMTVSSQRRTHSAQLAARTMASQPTWKCLQRSTAISSGAATMRRETVDCLACSAVCCLLS